MIEFSEIKTMAKALVKLQEEIKEPKKATQGHNYKYADLYALLVDLKPILAKHRFSCIQSPYGDGDTVGVETMLLHESGEYIKSKFSSGLQAAGMIKGCQAVGSQITYYRRYGLMAMLNLAPEDDDGKASSTSQPNPGNPNAKPSEKQFGAMFYKVKDNSCGMDDFNNEIKVKANLNQYKWLMDNFTKQNFDGLVAKLKGGK